MGVTLIGSCRICTRTSYKLNVDSHLCPQCASDPIAAKAHRSAFLVKVYAFRLLILALLGLIIYFATRPSPSILELLEK